MVEINPDRLTTKAEHEEIHSSGDSLKGRVVHDYPEHTVIDQLLDKIKELEDRISFLENKPSEYVPPPVIGPIDIPMHIPDLEVTCDGEDSGRRPFPITDTAGLISLGVIEPHVRMEEMSLEERKKWKKEPYDD